MTDKEFENLCIERNPIKVHYDSNNDDEVIILFDNGVSVTISTDYESYQFEFKTNIEAAEEERQWQISKERDEKAREQRYRIREELLKKYSEKEIMIIRKAFE